MTAICAVRGMRRRASTNLLLSAETCAFGPTGSRSVIFSTCHTARTIALEAAQVAGASWTSKAASDISTSTHFRKRAVALTTQRPDGTGHRVRSLLAVLCEVHGIRPRQVRRCREPGKQP
jgi:hypothetical protein